MNRGIRVGLSILPALLLILSAPGRAYADDCFTLTGNVPAGGECKVTSARTVAPAAYSLDETLHFLPGSSITVSPVTSPFQLSVTGSLVMDAGSKLSADSAAGPAGTITITTTVDITLKGGSPGALITANGPNTSCSPSKPKAGVIILAAAKNVLTEPGSEVDTIGPCGKGEITITGENVTIDGQVLSKGTTTKGAGGPITVKATCDFLESDTGVILSIGEDPGADLVHVEGGCSATIYGLVASTGSAHDITPPYPNKCADANHVGKPSNSLACVEIWAGENTNNPGGKAVVIDSRPPHNGEVHADTATGAGAGTKGTGWVDIFAKGDIEIDGDVALPFSVHANQGVGNGHGGLVTVKSTTKGVSLLGLALQASDKSSGGSGGTVTVHAKLDVNLNNSTGEIEAAGNPGGGGSQNGGHVFIRSFGNAPSTGSILVTAPFLLDVTGKTPPNGTVDLRACGTIAFAPFGPATGTIAPASIVPTGGTSICGGAPELPAGVVLPTCQCVALVCVQATQFTHASGTAAVSIAGTGLAAVDAVYANATCSLTGAVQLPITSQTNTNIVVNTAGVPPSTYHIILNIPGVGTECSQGTVALP